MLGRSLFVALLTLGAVPARAGSVTAPEWILLGIRDVSDRVDHDVIAVTRAEGRFSAIQIRVSRAAVDFHRVVVHFRNGGTQEVELRSTIPAGGESRRIELTGDDRIINRVEFWYDARTVRGRRAVVRLMGQR